MTNVRASVNVMPVVLRIEIAPRSETCVRAEVSSSCRRPPTGMLIGDVAKAQAIASGLRRRDHEPQLRRTRGLVRARACVRAPASLPASVSS